MFYIASYILDFIIMVLNILVSIRTLHIKVDLWVGKCPIMDNKEHTLATQRKLCSLVDKANQVKWNFLP